MCFDVTGFFDNLDHKMLKARLKGILGCDELDPDWFAVFSAVTRYRYVHLEKLKKHDHLKERIRERKHHPLATIQQVKMLGVPIKRTFSKWGFAGHTHQCEFLEIST